MAEGAARAAICAEFQGRFRQMHSLLMETSEWQEDGEWVSLARWAEVPDVDEFETCLGGNRVERRLLEDRELADALGVTATPTFFHRSGAHVGSIDGERLNGLVAEGGEG